MPTNKNALTRYKYLDEMLSDRHHFYDIHDLTEKCNEKLIDAGFPEVSQRCIEKDINYLEYDPFYAEIKEKTRSGRWSYAFITAHRKYRGDPDSRYSVWPRIQCPDR